MILSVLQKSYSGGNYEQKRMVKAEEDGDGATKRETRRKETFDRLLLVDMTSFDEVQHSDLQTRVPRDGCVDMKSIRKAEKKPAVDTPAPTTHIILRDIRR